jgi:hypothetical protein
MLTGTRVETAGTELMAAGSRVKAFGLCSTCNNKPSCVYRESRGKDAIYCEMFDSYTNGHRDSSASVKVVAESKPSGKYKGLCANCLHKEACVLNKPEGGVWHCEEYE